MLKLTEHNPYTLKHESIDVIRHFCLEEGKQAQLEADRKAILDWLEGHDRTDCHKVAGCHVFVARDKEYQQLKGK